MCRLARSDHAPSITCPDPDDYREPNHKWNDLAEVCDQLGQHEFGSVFADADEIETSRRMT